MSQAPYQDISIDEYQQQFKSDHAPDFTLVDVRETDEYSAGCVPGAINIPLSEFQHRFHEIADDKPVVLVCASGNRSAMAADFMAAMGYTDLYNLVDGTMGWMMRGLPLER